MGRAKLTSRDYPGGPPDGGGEIRACPYPWNGSRAAPLTQADMRLFITDASVAKRLGAKAPSAERIAAGLPGRFLDDADRERMWLGVRDQYNGSLASNARAFGEKWVGGQRPSRFEHVFASIQSLSANDLAALPNDPGREAAVAGDVVGVRVRLDRAHDPQVAVHGFGERGRARRRLQ